VAALFMGWTPCRVWKIIALAIIWAAIMEVGDWLRSLGLGQYEAAFRENAIDYKVVPKLTAEDLKEIGVAFVGHRRLMLAAIEALSASPPAPDDAAENAVSPRPQAPPPKTPPKSDTERRHLAVLFCDLVDSTRLAAALDAEDWHDLVCSYLDDASAAVTQMGGHVAKKLGDGIMALFGYPITQESDSERAVRAALAIQRGLADLNRKNAGSGRPKLAARIGVETGAVVVDLAGEIFGDVPNIAARVQALAESGTVLVTERVQRQVAGLFVAEDRGAHALKGLPEPTKLFCIVRASGGGRRSGQRALTPLVGRDEDIAMLVRRWERARQGEDQFMQIVGEPGIGKSRLIEEFHSRLRDTPHTWVEWSASQLLQNTPLHPIADWGRQRFGGADVAPERRLTELETTLAQVKLDPAEYAPLLAPLVDIPLPPHRVSALAPEELRHRQMTAILAWVTAGARVQPIVLVFEDLHWADPSTLDVLRGFAECSALVPLFVVATTRPEFRAPWGARSHHGTITLAPLDRAQVRQMVGDLAARYALSRDVIEGVTERAGGVPLFVEEITRLLLERGIQDGTQAIPPTLQQSLAARLDRLGPTREVAMIGAVLGRGFSYLLLRAVASMDDAPLREALDNLAEAGILLVEGLPPVADYRFKHALIQDAAYENLLKSRRQALHRRVAETLRDQFPARAEAEPEAVAHHFTLAGLAEPAIDWWGKAGDQALRRSAFQEAIVHLGKAIEMADKGAATREAPTRALDARRLKLQADYGAAMAWSRGFGADETQAAFARAKVLAAASDDSSERAATLYGLWVGHLVRAEMSAARDAAETFLREMIGGGPSARLATAHRCLGMTAWLQGDFLPARANLEAAIAMSDPDREREGRMIFGQDTTIIASSYLAQVCWHIGDPARACELMADARQRAEACGHLPTHVNAIDMAAILAVARGDFEAARPLAERMGQLAAGPGLTLYASSATLILSWTSARSEGAAVAAERMRPAIVDYTRPGSEILHPLYTGRLAELESGTASAPDALATADEALGFARRSGERWSDSLLHRIRGDILLKTNPENPAPAEQAYLAAVAVAQEQGARSFGLQAALKLGKLYLSTARPVEAHDTLATALQGFSPTPELPEIAEAQALLAALADGVTSSVMQENVAGVDRR
jgi:class 3 adenylate cyclase/predicted ATPase